MQHVVHKELWAFAMHILRYAQGSTCTHETRLAAITRATVGTHDARSHFVVLSDACLYVYIVVYILKKAQYKLFIVRS